MSSILHARYPRHALAQPLTRFASETHRFAGEDHGRGFRTGLAALDSVLPGGGFAVQAVHEVLVEPSVGPPLSFVSQIAQAAAAAAGSGVVIWCDRRGGPYPPALTAADGTFGRLLVVRTRGSADEVWAATECLRSKAVGVVVAFPERLSRVEARRLRLAAEQGGGVAVLLRPAGSGSRHHAATTRWSVRPMQGDAYTQRWIVRLIHGHGGRVDEDVVLEVDRDRCHVRSAELLARRSDRTSATVRLA